MMYLKETLDQNPEKSNITIQKMTNQQENKVGKDQGSEITLNAKK